MIDMFAFMRNKVSEKKKKRKKSDKSSKIFSSIG
jgi:hypothetical protein